MKHCPECNRNYADPTVSYCLEDGAVLIHGEAVEDPDTVILPAAPVARKSSKMIWVVGAVAVVIVLALVLGYRYFATANTKQIESIAVLPFENGSGDTSLDYLSDGL